MLEVNVIVIVSYSQSGHTNPLFLSLKRGTVISDVSTLSSKVEHAFTLYFKISKVNSRTLASGFYVNESQFKSRDRISVITVLTSELQIDAED